MTMTTLQATILGLLQGLAEFLPISSSGHLTVAQTLMGISGDGSAMLLLGVLLHAGTLIAVCVVFFQEFIHMLRHPVKDRTLLLLIIASIPALIAALLLGDTLDDLFKGGFLGISFLITALFLVLCERLSRAGGKHRQRANEPGVKHALSMGVMQAVALLPGVSRSGSTLLGGVGAGMSRRGAAKFSFMMSAVAILGSLVTEGKNAIDENVFSALPPLPLAVGVLVAAVSGYLAIRFMLKLIERVSLYWFAAYAAALGAFVLYCQLTGTLGFPPIGLG